MTITTFVGNLQNSVILSQLNDTSRFYTSASQAFNTDPIVDGVGFDFDINNPQGVVNLHDNNTLIFLRQGKYLISYTLTVYVHDTNLVPDLTIRPSVHSSSTFPDYDNYAVNTVRKTVQTSTDKDVITGHEVNTVSDTFYHPYDGGDNKYFKLFVWGPNSDQSYIEYGLSLNFNYLGS